MTTGQLLDLLTEFAKEYRLDCKDNINRNYHMHNAGKNVDISQETVDAVLIGFINSLAAAYYVDYCLYATDLKASSVQHGRIFSHLQKLKALKNTKQIDYKFLINVIHILYTLDKKQQYDNLSRLLSATRDLIPENMPLLEKGVGYD